MSKFPVVKGMGGNLQEALTTKVKVQTKTAGNIQHMRYDSYSGEWSFGKDNEDLSGEEVTIITNSIVHGWHRWADQEVFKRMANMAEFLQDIRRQRGLSLRGLARESGISASTLSRWCDGKQIPSPKSCRMLADYLSLPTEHVLALAGHLKPLHKEATEALPEFREYARQKYPEDLDEDMITMIEDLIYRRRRRREQGN